MLRDDSDIVGDAPAAAEDFSLRMQDVHAVLGGVSVPWLMKAFAIGRQTVEKKLRGCVPVGQGKHGTPLYDLKEAASFLVVPRVGLEEYVKSLKPDQLPERLRDSFWAAKLKEQRWEEKAGDLWRTAIVVSKLTGVLMSMRTRLQLIPEEVERHAGLSPKQRAAVVEVVDDIQSQIHQQLIEFAKKDDTRSQIAELGEDEVEDDII